MLLVLYGSTAEVGYKSREFLVNAGFELIEKVNYASEHVVANTRYGTRKWVSKAEFYNQTDSLFRYDIGGIHVGFNQEQILDAVSNNANKLLTLSSPDVSLLREIKQVYGEAVRVIYCYIDKTTLEQLVSAFSDIKQEETRFRLETGEVVRRQYSLHSDLFDHVVIYNGENSEFDMEHLLKQYQSIIDPLRLHDNNIEAHDVFLSYAHRDSEAVKTIINKLKDNGINVFQDDAIPSSADFSNYIKKAISSSKVVAPIITQNAVKSKWVKKEIEEALRIAEDSAVVVIPVFLDVDIDLNEFDGISQLSVMQGVICQDGSAGNAGERLSQIIKKIFTGMDYLEWYSEQVNNYICIKAYDKAFEIQKAHRDLCIELSNSSHGKYVGVDAIINSEIKLISILIDMKNWKEALDETIEALRMLDDDSIKGVYDALKDQFAICCVGCNYSEEKVAAIIEEDLNKYKFGVEYLGKLMDHFNFDLCEDLLKEFKFKKDKKEKEAIKRSKESTSENDTVKIAQHGEAAMRLFDGLVNSGLTEQMRGSMIEGYQRVLNYCLQLGLSEEISSECIRKIAELKEKEPVDSPEISSIVSALKVFLGQAVPGSGNYDVFISFKSEDEDLARKVYDFLKQNGKETFFSKESLPQLGESEYEDAIYEALDNSKHLVLVASNPEYFKTDWVSREWKYFNNKNRKSEKKGNIVIILPGEYVTDTEKLPPQLRYEFEIIRIPDFKDRLLSYTR